MPFDAPGSGAKPIAGIARDSKRTTLHPDTGVIAGISAHVDPPAGHARAHTPPGGALDQQLTACVPAPSPSTRRRSPSI